MGSVPEGGNPWLQFVPFVLVLAIFYFIILLPMRRKQQKVQTFLESLKVGDRVSENTIVCIVEAMKVMNEVKAGVSGTIAEVLVDTGQPVEFGTKLFRIV